MIASQVKMYESDLTTRCHCSLSSSGSPERILTSQLNTWNLINTTDEVVLSPRVRSPPRLWAARRRPHTASFRKQDKNVWVQGTSSHSRVVFFHAGIGLPGRENLFVLKLLHAGGGSHRHGDYYVVDVEGAFTSPPLDWLLLENKGGV